MKALLNALQEGRLVELPDTLKNDALEFLGTLIEAIPEVPNDDGITEKALAARHCTTPVSARVGPAPMPPPNSTGNCFAP